MRVRRSVFFAEKQAAHRGWAGKVAHMFWVLKVIVRCVAETDGCICRSQRHGTPAARKVSELKLCRNTRLNVSTRVIHDASS
eukprot:2266689-Rhodomonas_salina.1